MSDILDLIARWQAGDQQAAERLYAQSRERVFRLAYGLLGNPEDAEEVAQDALTYALVNINRYEPDRALFSTWLHTITVSRVRDRQRRKRFALTSLTDWLAGGRDVVAESPHLEERLQQGFARREVWEAVQTLSPPLREAVILRYWAQNSFREMAEIMDCPVGTAQSRVRRGFEQLAEALSADLLTHFEDA
jgi:RNA polymerase sigma-70 factor (ECF subfamily)